MGQPLLEMRNISKLFPGVQALQDVSIDLYSGEVLGLVGENGAGKSTLIKILAGDYRADSGEILINGRKVDFRSPLEACAAGIHAVHQIINDGVVQQLTVAKNLALDEICQPAGPVMLNRRRIAERAAAIQTILGLDLPLDRAMSDLGQAERQLIAIARACPRSRRCRFRTSRRRPCRSRRPRAYSPSSRTCGRAAWRSSASAIGRQFLAIDLHQLFESVHRHFCRGTCRSLRKATDARWESPRRS